MIEPARIAPEDARKRVLSGEALLVCAYEDEEKFKKIHLEGSISYLEFKNRVGSLSREQEIIFY